MKVFFSQKAFYCLGRHLGYLNLLELTKIRQIPGASKVDFLRGVGKTEKITNLNAFFVLIANTKKMAAESSLSLESGKTTKTCANTGRYFAFSVFAKEVV